MIHCVVIRTLVALVTAVLLASCGGGSGGGSGGGGPPLPSKFLYASAYSVSASGTTSGAIYAFSVNPATGVMSPLGGSPFAPTSGTAQISFAISRDSKFLYAGAPDEASPLTGKLSAFLIRADGSLTAVPGAPFSTSDSPEVLVAHPTADLLYVGGARGSVSVFAIDTATGALSLTSSIDLGAGGELPGGAIITSDGRYYYQSSGPSSLIAGFSINGATGALSAAAGSPSLLPPATSIPAGVAVDHAGKFLFVGNAFPEMLYGLAGWVFSIDATSGALAELPGAAIDVGGIQGSLTIDASGKFLIVEVFLKTTPKNCIAVLSIDPNTGTLTSVPGSPFAGQCGVIAADPAAPYVYIGGGGVFAYLINESTGALSPIGSADIPAGMTVSSIALTH